MNKDKIVYLEYRDIKGYPEQNPLFHPSISYPEYPFGTELVSKAENQVYDMVRATLYGLGLDEGNFGKNCWNPLGDYISQGERVVIKPNMVKHYDSLEQYNCTLTHPSVVRAIIDYCIIADAGNIILGDGPIQGADINKIKKNLYYDEMINFYRNKNIKIEFMDFRRTIVSQDHGVLKTIQKSNSDEFISVDLGKKSEHYDENLQTKYEICGYVNEQLNKNHNKVHHQYFVSKSILQADVIINLPKPKTHRFAGLTGAQKNFVGASSDKESLPHYKAGTKEEGGDETNSTSLLSRIIAKVYRQYLWECKKEKYVKARIYYLLYALVSRFKGKAFYTHGAWYGNDTIWRTIIDLNNIIFYADKNGNLDFSERKRKVLTIGDMIIAGEKDGPLLPDPKQLGCILGSKSCPVFDYVFCRIAGFDENKIPTIYHGLNNNKLCSESWKTIQIFSNELNLNGQILENLTFPDTYHFEPHPFWRELL